MLVLSQLTTLYALLLAVVRVTSYRQDAAHIRVLENVTQGTVVLQDIRSYLNFPGNSVVRLGPGSLSQFFRLDGQTGELIVTSKLDLEDAFLCKVERSCCREEISQKSDSPQGFMTKIPSLSSVPGSTDQCNLMAFILLKAPSDSRFSPVTRFYVTVIDVNDHAPTFKITSTLANNLQTAPYLHKDGPMVISLEFLESRGGLGSRRDLPSPYDIDFSAQNRVKRYWLEWMTPKTATTTANGHHSSISLEQHTVDPMHSSMLTLEEHPTQSVSWAVLGPFRLIYLEAGRTIALELNAELDYEKQQQYQLRLVAEDGGGLRGDLIILVTVIDVNEFAPVFTDSLTASTQTFLASLKEGQDQEPRVYRRQYSVKESHKVGTEIASLHAVDGDYSTRNKVHYRVGSVNPTLDGTETFHLDSITGVLMLKSKLDYETVKQYQLTIIAEDGAENNRNAAAHGVVSSLLTLQRSATALIDISVLDVNDNAPVIRFEKDDQKVVLSPDRVEGIFSIDRVYDQSVGFYTVSVKENVAPGSSVVFFTVNDRDMGDNGHIYCKLTNWTDQFKLQDFGGGLFGIQTATELDRETIDKYRVPVHCQDQGNPPLTTTQLLVVQVEDINDMPPVFASNSYHFRVAENSPLGTPMRSLREAYSPSVVTAVDPDLNSTIRYRLEPADIEADLRKPDDVLLSPLNVDHQLFRIDSKTGKITTQGELDREKYPRLNFRVCADDNLHTSCASVHVTLDDANDNRPRFDRDTYVLRVEENQLPQKPIVTFKVTDADIGNQGFTFNFADMDLQPEPITVPRHAQNSSNHTSFPPQRWHKAGLGTVPYHFVLRDQSLYIRRPLDRETKASYHFCVEAVDSQRPSIADSNFPGHAVQLKGQAEIFIDITDVNDNSPVFIFPNSTVPLGNNRMTISCHEAMGITVGQLQANDVDLGPNGTVTFSLINSAESAPLFHLDSQTGDLFVNTGQLSERCGETVLLVVSVDDLGPADSKAGRPMTMERLIVKMEDRPTKAELLAAEVKQQLWQASIAESLANKSEGQLAISTKTALSVVLGGSTIFLICILIIWLVLLLYHRSKRLRRQKRRAPSYPVTLNPGSPGYGSTGVEVCVDGDDKKHFRSIKSIDPQTGQYTNAIVCERVVGGDGNCLISGCETSLEVEDPNSMCASLGGKGDTYQKCFFDRCRSLGDRRVHRGSVWIGDAHRGIDRDADSEQVIEVVQEGDEINRERFHPKWVVKTANPHLQASLRGYQPACYLVDSRQVTMRNTGGRHPEKRGAGGPSLAMKTFVHQASTSNTPQAKHVLVAGRPPTVGGLMDQQAFNGNTLAYTALRRVAHTPQPGGSSWQAVRLNNTTAVEDRDQVFNGQYPSFYTPPPTRVHRLSSFLHDNSQLNKQKMSSTRLNSDYTNLLNGREKGEFEVVADRLRQTTSIPALFYVQPEQSASSSSAIQSHKEELSKLHCLPLTSSAEENRISPAPVTLLEVDPTLPPPPPPTGSLHRLDKPAPKHQVGKSVIGGNPSYAPGQRANHSVCAQCQPGHVHPLMLPLCEDNCSLSRALREHQTFLMEEAEDEEDDDDVMEQQTETYRIPLSSRSPTIGYLTMEDLFDSCV